MLGGVSLPFDEIAHKTGDCIGQPDDRLGFIAHSANFARIDLPLAQTLFE